MPFITTHTATHGKGTYDVHKLERLVARRTHEKIPLKTLNINRSKKSGFSPKSRLPTADTRKPVIIASDGSLLDGRHRAAKLEDLGKRFVKAVRATERDLSKARVKSRVPAFERHDHYANLPIKPKGFTLTGRRSELPEGWAEDYTRTLAALSLLNMNKPLDAVRAQQLEKYLDRLENHTVHAGRGRIYRPHPDGFGRYPDLHNLPLVHIKTAIRANSPSATRARAWSQVAAAARPFRPGVGESAKAGKNGMDVLQQRRFMEAAAISLPVAQGREPRFLGEKVPGELSLGPTGTRTIIGGSQMTTSDWNGRGFSPMKFSKTMHYRGAFRGTRRASWLKKLRHVKTVGKQSWKVIKDNPVASVATGYVGGVVGAPLYETPGFAAGFDRGAKDQKLTGVERISRRIIPGYMDGFDKGQETRKEIKGAKKDPTKAWGYSLPVTRETSRVRRNDKIRSAQEIAGTTIQNTGRFIRDVVTPVTAIPAANWAANSIADNGVKSLANRQFVKRLAVPVAVGTAAQGFISGGKRLREHAERKTKDVVIKNSNNDDKYYYELGFVEGIKDHWKRIKSGLKRDLVPTAVRGAFVGGLGKLHQEVGLPPTTVDGIPVNRRSINGSMSPYTTLELERARSNIVMRINNNRDPMTTQSLTNTLQTIDQEIAMRRTLPST